MADVQNDPDLEAELLGALDAWNQARPRTQQTTIGPSEVGGCREYLRAKIVGDPELPERPRGVDGAFIGTIVGDALEAIFAERLDVETQQAIVTEFAELGLTVAGHTDILYRLRNMILDLKSKDGLAEIRYKGPSLENLIQVAIYVTGAIQRGILQPGAEGRLVYYDRSGKDKTFFAVTVPADAIETFYQLAIARVTDVLDVIDRGSPEEDRWELRDQSPSLCFAVQCPFREACWGGSEWQPTGKITGEDELAIVADFIEAREQEADIKKRRENLREKMKALAPGGVTPDGWVVSWKANKDGEPSRLDVVKA